MLRYEARIGRASEAQIIEKGQRTELQRSQAGFGIWEALALGHCLQMIPKP